MRDVARGRPSHSPRESDGKESVAVLRHREINEHLTRKTCRVYAFKVPFARFALYGLQSRQPARRSLGLPRLWCIESQCLLVNRFKQVSVARVQALRLPNGREAAPKLLVLQRTPLSASG